LDEVHSDVFAFDMSGAQYRKNEDPGEEIGPDPDNGLVGATLGVIWNDQHVTMTRYCSQHMIEDGIALGNFAQVVSLCHEGYSMGYVTSSSFLLGQWERMNEWKSQGFEGLNRDAWREAWHRIMRSLDVGHRSVQMSFGTGEEYEAVHRAPTGYALEVVSNLEETLRRPVDAIQVPLTSWH
jgi:hypothetical protein